jgi:hypothetical protein
MFHASRYLSAIAKPYCLMQRSAYTGGFFEPLRPNGSYTLKLDDPYEWAVAYELLRNAALRPSCEVCPNKLHLLTWL